MDIPPAGNKNRTAAIVRMSYSFIGVMLVQILCPDGKLVSLVIMSVFKQLHNRTRNIQNQFSSNSDLAYDVSTHGAANKISKNVSYYKLLRQDLCLQT